MVATATIATIVAIAAIVTIVTIVAIAAIVTIVTIAAIVAIATIATTKIKCVLFPIFTSIQKNRRKNINGKYINLDWLRQISM